MIGFSFSPGGLLFPYHLGVIESLSTNGHLTPHSPIAGSSAGAIAVAVSSQNPVGYFINLRIFILKPVYSRVAL